MIVALCALSSHAQQPRQIEAERRQASQQQQQASPAAPSGLSFREAKEAEAARGRQATDDYRNGEQLKYEKRAFWLGVVQAFIGVAGLIGLGATVLYARGAWIAGHRSAEAAEKGFLATARPFIALDHIHSQVLDTAIAFTAVWKNCGDTPAIHCMSAANWMSFNGYMPADFSFPDFHEGEWIKRCPEAPPFYIAPSGTKLTLAHEIPVSVIDNAAAGGAKIYFWGWIEYDDTVAKTRRRTEFCDLISVRWLPGSLEETGEYKNAAAIGYTTHWRHNGIDEGCMKQPQPYKKPS